MQSSSFLLSHLMHETRAHSQSAVSSHFEKCRSLTKVDETGWGEVRAEQKSTSLLMKTLGWTRWAADYWRLIINNNTPGAKCTLCGVTCRWEMLTVWHTQSDLNLPKHRAAQSDHFQSLKLSVPSISCWVYERLGGDAPHMVFLCCCFWQPKAVLWESSLFHKQLPGRDMWCL